MSADPKSVAAIVTEYTENTHADMIVGRVLEGYNYDGRDRPALRLASLYTDQVPRNDWSRALAKKHGVPVFDSIEDALTLGTSRLNVEGVLCILESGRYSVNAIGLVEYPYRRVWEAIFKTFANSGHAVPTFHDAMLGASWSGTTWLYTNIRRHMVPVLAGSVLPWTWRQPPLELPVGCRIKEAVAVAFGDPERHGFHALEMLQCMVERRRGGESGVEDVRCLTGQAVWHNPDWSQRLLEAALRQCRTVPGAKPEEICRDSAVAFIIDYADGLEATVLLLNGYVADFAFAARLRGSYRGPGIDLDIASCRFYLQPERPYAHFATQVRAIETLMSTAHPPAPLERTLLTTGMLESLLISRARGGAKVRTPHLRFCYQPR